MGGVFGGESGVASGETETGVAAAAGGGGGVSAVPRRQQAAGLGEVLGRAGGSSVSRSTPRSASEREREFVVSPRREGGKCAGGFGEGGAAAPPSAGTQRMGPLQHLSVSGALLLPVLVEHDDEDEDDDDDLLCVRAPPPPPPPHHYTHAHIIMVYYF